MGIVKEEIGVMVSVCCATYNHEKYIEKTLQGFVNQKTDFTFEVLIHDDASTDGTVAIIEKYREQYPELIKPIYQKENQYSKGIKITPTFQYPRVKGQYIAFCEGDDYWCDEHKLQKQVEVMKKNEDCSICVHTVECIKENGEFLDEKYPQKAFKTGRIEQSEYVELLLNYVGYLFQTSCYLFKAKYVVEILENMPEFMKVARVGDVPLLMFLATKGGAYYISETMSIYRRFSDGSWTKQMKNNQLKALTDIESNILMLEKYDDYTGGRYTTSIDKYLENLKFNRLICIKRYARLEKKSFTTFLKKNRFKKEMKYGILFIKILYLYPIYNKIKKLFK